MIKNAQEARDALNIFKDQIVPITSAIYLHEYKFAEGYLAALNGPEMEELLAAAKKFEEEVRDISACDYLNRSALLQERCAGFREAIAKAEARS